MKKNYEAPTLFCDEFVADTMIASSGSPKNGNADNNQNCWGQRYVAGEPDPSNPSNACYT